MIRVKKFDNESEWLATRKNFIGATEVSALLGLNEYQTATDVWYSKVHDLEHWSGDAATDMGKALEPVLLAHAESVLNCTLHSQIHYADDDSKMAATIDGIDKETNTIVEVKTAGIMNPMFNGNDAWGDEFTDNVPMQYWVQVQAQLLLTKSQLAHLFALIAGRGFVQYTITPDIEIQQTLQKVCKAWWEDHVIAKVAPTQPASIEVLKRVKRERASVALPTEAIEWISAYQAATNLAKQATKEAEVAKCKLIELLGNADEGVTPDRQVVSFIERSRKGYVVEPTSYRSFSIKKGK